MSRRSIVLVGVSILVGCGGKDQPRSTFVLDVLASQSALDSFVLSAEGLDLPDGSWKQLASPATTPAERAAAHYPAGN